MIQDNKRIGIRNKKVTRNADLENTLSRHGQTISKLRQSLHGRLILPADAGYGEARVIFYAGFEHQPAMIARAADAEDIARVVSLAGETGLQLAVRSGGHSLAGHSLTEGGIVLDLRDMKALDINPNNRTAWVESGMTTGEYTSAADAYGLATGFGDTATVGLGGLTLGGGIGYLSRKHGLTIDNLLAAEMVTADGKLLHVDGESHPDLFWAIRGGGGNFGVATRFQFRLHEAGEVAGGMLFLPATPEVIAGFIAAAEAAPEELSTIANIMPAPPMPFLPVEQHGKLILMALMVYAGNIKTGMDAFAPFRKLDKPIADMLRPMRYPEMFPPEQGGFHPMAMGHNMFLNKVDHEVSQTIVEYLQASDAPMRVTQLRMMGGAIGRVDVHATAFAHRRSRIMVNLGVFYTGPADQEKQQSWLSDLASALQQEDQGAYVNFMGAGSEARLRAAYPGQTWERLRDIKRRYDPSNLFRLNHNIQPLDEGSDAVSFKH